MANALYDAAKANFLTAGLGDLTSVSVSVSLIDDTDYVVNLTTDDFEDDVTGAGQVADGVITITSALLGQLDGNDVTYSTVSGDVSEALVLYVGPSGSPDTDPLIAYLDTFSSGMPVTPNGGDIIIQWASGIVFSIG